MSNILFIGPYRQSDGWGNASKEYVRALCHTQHNLSVRPIYLNNQHKYQEFQEFSDLEQSRYDNYDIIIQHCLPNLFRKYGNVKNIGISFFESTIASTPWPHYIKLLDQLWVTSEFEKNVYLKGIENIEVVHLPTDMAKYDLKYPCSIDLPPDEFRFYFIGELITRKNVAALLTAFHREFKKHEQVRLVLKLNKVGMDEYQVLEETQKFTHNVKQSLKIYDDPSQYKPEIVIPTYLPEEELYGLHQKCDCFVMPSSGEAFCIPAFDAMMFGKPVISNLNTGISEFNKMRNMDNVDSLEVPCVVPDRPMSYLYTGKDTWYSIDVLRLQLYMREIFTRKNIRYDNPATSIMGLYPRSIKKTIKNNYSYKSVAQRIEELLV